MLTNPTTIREATAVINSKGLPHVGLFFYYGNSKNFSCDSCRYIDDDRIQLYRFGSIPEIVQGTGAACDHHEKASRRRIGEDQNRIGVAASLFYRTPFRIVV